MRTTGAGSLLGFALTGLVLGWLLRPVSIQLGGVAPTVSWLQVLALFFVALILGSVAWSTYHSLHKRHQRIEPHRAVNRLVLAKSCALAGAMVAGVYFGYALSWVGVTAAELAEERITHSLLAGLASVLIVAGSLFLERACRVNGGGGSDTLVPMAISSPNRRRQRSVRVTVATALLALAALAVVAALPTQSVGWLSASSVFALLAGSAASRIIYNELLQSRREAATDRAEQAQAYRTMFSERAEEHAEFTTAMTDRLANRDRSISELEDSIVLAEQRAIEAETRVQRESRRANDAMGLVGELQETLEIRKAEQADELASWEGWEGALRDGEADAVVGLLEWDVKVNAGASADDETKRA